MGVVGVCILGLSSADPPPATTGYGQRAGVYASYMECILVLVKYLVESHRTEAGPVPGTIFRQIL